MNNVENWGGFNTITIYLIKKWWELNKYINEEWSWRELSVIEGFIEGFIETMAFIIFLIGVSIIIIPSDIILFPFELIGFLLYKIFKK